MERKEFLFPGNWFKMVEFKRGTSKRVVEHKRAETHARRVSVNRLKCGENFRNLIFEEKKKLILYSLGIFQVIIFENSHSLEINVIFNLFTKHPARARQIGTKVKFFEFFR